MSKKATEVPVKNTITQMICAALQLHLRTGISSDAEHSGSAITQNFPRKACQWRTCSAKVLPTFKKEVEVIMRGGKSCVCAEAYTSSVQATVLHSCVSQGVHSETRCLYLTEAGYSFPLFRYFATLGSGRKLLSCCNSGFFKHLPTRSVLHQLSGINTAQQGEMLVGEAGRRKSVRCWAGVGSSRDQ